MFHHVVLMQLGPTADRPFLERVHAYAEQIRRETTGLREYVFRRNQASRSDGLNWAVVSSFFTAADHDAYQVSALHQEMKAFMTPHIARIVACDIDEEQRL